MSDSLQQNIIDVAVENTTHCVCVRADKLEFHGTDTDTDTDTDILADLSDTRVSSRDCRLGMRVCTHVRVYCTR